MKLTTEQSKCVQVLRGLAIIAVVFIHDTPSGLSQVFCRPFLNFSVGLFLFLSGMLSAATKWNPKKRIVKVIIPYIIWSFVYTVLHNVERPAGIPVAFLKNLLTAEAAAVMYYIFVYCELTLLIPLIDKLAKSRYKYWGFAITPIEIIVMRLIPAVAGQEVNAYVSMIMSVSCMGWFSYFYLGYLLGNKYITVNIAPKKVALLWVVSILLQIGEGFYYYTLGKTDCGTQLKLTAVLSGVLVALMAYDYVVKGKNRKTRLLSLLGDYSFGIYFSHLAVMSVIYKIPGVVHFPYPITSVIIVTLTAVCVWLGRKCLGKYSTYLAL